jgi:hypothetical protein
MNPHKDNHIKTIRNRQGQIEKLLVCELFWESSYKSVEHWTQYREYDPPIEEEQIEKEIERLLGDEKYFGTCNSCGKRKLRGNMGQGVCHFCLEKDGIVF